VGSVKQLKVVVTGAGGYLGTTFIHQAPRRWNIIPLFRSSVDVTRAADVRRLAAKIGTADVLVHLAAAIDICFEMDSTGWLIPCNEDPANLIKTNVAGTSLMVELANRLRVKQFVFASSQAVYGNTERVLYEDTQPRPIEHYAMSKVAGEAIVKTGLREAIPTIARLSGLFGGDRKGGMIWQMCDSAKYNNGVTVLLDKPIPYSAISVSDAAAALIGLVGRDTPYTTYNIGPKERTSIPLFGSWIANLKGCVFENESVPQPEIQLDVSRIGEATGWSPIPIVTSLASFMDRV